QQFVVNGLARRRNGVPRDGGRKAPAVENGQDQGFWTRHQTTFPCALPTGCRNALTPANRAASPSFSSIRSSWLYFAIRSVLLADPVLICPSPVATARSAMNGSSVSPERCDTIDVYPAAAALCIDF